MYSVLLPLLLLGLWPTAIAPSADAMAISRLPVAPPAISFVIAEHLSASGVLVADAATGQPLYGKQASYRRPMASLTKLMTALLIVEQHDMNELVTVPASVADVAGNRVPLRQGDQFSVGELLTALLLPSANDAAIALAEYHSGSVEAFVADMNARADQLGLDDTHFDNPTGMDSPDQYATPTDLAWLVRFVLNEPEIAKRMGQRGARITSQAGTDITLSHTHDLLHLPNSPIVAGKTGTTIAAGECLISVLETGGRRYVVVLLNSSRRYEDMRAVMRVLQPSE